MRKILLTTAAMLFTACSGSSSPTSSTPTIPTTPAPTTASPATTNWMVTHRFVSVAGADNCWIQRQRASLTGVVFPNLDMSVTRSSSAFVIASGWFETYTGTSSGNDFTARQSVPLQGGGFDCAGTRITQLPGVSNLAGRFASDGQTMSATESNVYPLNTGETVTYTWNWEATRIN